MDVLNSLSRWIVGKRVEMHQIFEQCSQGYPRKEASVVGASRRLTHSQAEGGVLNMLKQLPMGMAMGFGMDRVTSDKYPYQCHMGPMDSMGFPVVGPKGDMGHMPPYSQCLGGNPGSVTVSPAKNNISHQQQRLKQPSFPSKEPGKYHDVFQYTDAQNPQPQANQTKGGHFQELSKSSMWKHIFAPPFTPASAKTKYPYSMTTDPAPCAPRADLSHLYPYARRAETATETMHMGAACGYPSGSFFPGAPCFTSQMGTLGSECPAFSAAPNYSPAQPYMPCYISFIGQPSPMSVQQCQQIFVSHPVNTGYCHQSPKASQGSAGHRPCYPTSAHQPAPTQHTQTVKEEKPKLPPTPPKQDNPPAIAEVVDGIESLHVSPKMDEPKPDVDPASAPVDSLPQSVQSSEDTVSESTSMELDCDIQQEADSVQLESSESLNSDNVDTNKCAQADSSVAEHQMESGQESNTPKPQPPKSSSNKDSHIFRQPCATTPMTNPRKKRKCRPSAEKRRRRRMSAICPLTAKPTPTRPNSGSASNSKKLKTDHVLSSEEAADRSTMSATVAFILGLDSEDEVDEVDNSKSNIRSNAVKPSHVKSFCFSISSCSDSDSDFDDVSGGSDTTDGVLDELTWGGLNFSLDPFRFQCLSSTPIPIKKTMSSPQLTSCSGQSEADSTHPLSWSPTRRTSLGKHVKFASDDLLVTVHTIDDELEAYQEARKGDWEQFARDRCRFKDRSNDIEKAISWVFDPDHRVRIQRQLQRYSQSSSSQ